MTQKRPSPASGKSFHRVSNARALYLSLAASAINSWVNVGAAALVGSTPFKHWPNPLRFRLAGLGGRDSGTESQGHVVGRDR